MSFASNHSYASSKSKTRYPGTAVKRLQAIHARVESLVDDDDEMQVTKSPNKNDDNNANMDVDEDSVSKSDNTSYIPTNKHSQKLSSLPWHEVRKLLLWAGGLKDYPNPNIVPPGQGYTGHTFNDDNHCDLCAMASEVQEERNQDGRVKNISRSNFLGEGIRNASLQFSDPSEKPYAGTSMELGVKISCK